VGNRLGRGGELCVYLLLLAGCAVVPYEAPRGAVWGYVVPWGGTEKYELLVYYASQSACLAHSDGSWGPPRGSAPCRPLIVGEGEQRFWAYDFKGIKPGSLGATSREACEYQRQGTTARTSPCVPIAVRFIE